tara:strand:+ start:4525 stop:5040 length:516 start_codon:yes stop_codon:yes gene_type:complete
MPDSNNNDEKKSQSRRFLFRNTRSANKAEAKAVDGAEQKELMKRDELSEQMLSIARRGTDEQFEEIMRKGANIRYIDPKHHTNILHRAASVAAFKFIRMLVDNGYDLDFLVKDHQGRFPSAIAMEVADEPELAEFLLEKEIEQAQRLGQDYQALLIEDGPWAPSASIPSDP